MIILDELVEALPKKHKKNVTAKTVRVLNRMIEDDTFREHYANNLITYTSVLQEGRFKLTDYFNAVMFVSYKTQGLSNFKAYNKVFKDKCDDILRNGQDKNKIDKIQSYASMYNKTKLVSLIYEQSLIPDYIMYASARHKAIAKQVSLLDSNNDFVAQKAADSLMNHLKAPEESKLTLNVPTQDTGVISELSEAISNLSKQQALAIQNQETTIDTIAESTIISKEEVNGD